MSIRSRADRILYLLLLSAFEANAQMTDVLTHHNDNARTGQAVNEYILRSANVNITHFGKLRVLNTDGKVDAQPLYAAGVAIPGKGLKNVLFVATEHGSVYAFDADGTNIFWKISLLGAGETPSDNRSCSQVTPEIGITATPVIDRQLGPNGTLFAVCMSKNGSGNYFQRIHALDLGNGAARVPAVAVAATYPGTGDNSSNGQVVFAPAQTEERAGLLLLNGIVYTAWTSHCDIRPYTGWIIGYDEQTLTRTSVLNITPNGNRGAIWMSGAGLAADSDSNIYFLVGNGSFDTTLNASGFPNQGNYGNAFMKLSTAGNTLTVADYFATFQTPTQNSQDLDFGSGGALVLPDMLDSQNQIRKLAVGTGKDQNLYLVDRLNMGKFNPANDNAIYQKMSGVLPGGVWAMPAYHNGTIYYGSVNNHLLAFPFQNARLLGSSSQSASTFVYPGATPSISASGSSNGIVWVSENTAPAVLHAYAATDLAQELYNSNQAPGGRDQFGTGNKFITPTIASARVYVGTTTGAGVFGLLDQSTLTPLQVWRDNHFGNPSDVGVGANGVDVIGDGLPNLVKYALGLDPFTPTADSQAPAGTIQQFGGQQYLTLTVNRAARLTDVGYIVEVSGDRTTWVSGAPNTVTIADTPTQLIVRDNTPVGPASRFIRLAITAPGIANVVALTKSGSRTAKGGDFDNKTRR